jgi:glutamyl-tRNA synthetase
MKQEIIDLVFPNPLPTPEELENKYALRDLPKNAEVTRIAPSPTGMMHVGTVYGALIDERLAHQSGGVFMLRLEDTDQKREVKEAVDLILRVFNDCQILNDEGPVFGKEEQGNYGPYFQSARKEIYHAFEVEIDLHCLLRSMQRYLRQVYPLRSSKSLECHTVL